MAVANPLLVDVFHGEGGGEVGMLSAQYSLQGAVAWGLHNGECHGYCLSKRQKARRDRKSITEGAWVSGNS